MTATACPLDGQRGLELKLDELPGGKENPPEVADGFLCRYANGVVGTSSRQMNEVLPLVAAQDQRKQAMVLGTVLTREWNGQFYRVMVVEGGFAFEGKTFDSLSKIAFAITGTNWNGPRFFGLRAGNGKGVRT